MNKQQGRAIVLRVPTSTEQSTETKASRWRVADYVGRAKVLEAEVVGMDFGELARPRLDGHQPTRQWRDRREHGKTLVWAVEQERGRARAK